MMNMRTRRVAGLATAASVALLLAACAGPAEEVAPTGDGSADCIPAPPDALPGGDGAVKEVTGVASDALRGYPGDVFASPWADFTPASAPPWTVGFSGNEANPANDLMQEGIQEVLDAHPDLFDADLIAVTATPANDAASQIQGMRSLLLQGADIILAPLASPTALNQVIDDAAAEGVPVVSLLGQATSTNAVNVQPNPVQVGYDGAAGVAELMGGSGDVLMVHGIPGLSIDTHIFDAGKAVFDACEDISIVGELTGYFDPATAKTETLKFFATHPGDVDGAFNVSNMAYGIISAFEQTGRAVPPVADVGANGAAMAYWRDHPDYPGVAVSLPVKATARYGMEVGLAMLQGRGLRVTDVPFSPTVITHDTLEDWVDPSWNETSNLYADGPADSIPVEELLSGYFAR